MLDSTNMSADPFSDILKLTNAESLGTGDFTAGGAWAVRFPAPEKINLRCRKRLVLGLYRWRGGTRPL